MKRMALAKTVLLLLCALVCAVLSGSILRRCVFVTPDLHVDQRDVEVIDALAATLSTNARFRGLCMAPPSGYKLGVTAASPSTFVERFDSPSLTPRLSMSRSMRNRMRQRNQESVSLDQIRFSDPNVTIVRLEPVDPYSNQYQMLSYEKLPKGLWGAISPYRPVFSRGGKTAYVLFLIGPVPDKQVSGMYRFEKEDDRWVADEYAVFIPM